MVAASTPGHDGIVAATDEGVNWTCHHGADDSVTTPSVALLAVAAVFAVGDWTARWRGERRLEYLCKPATILVLLVTAVVIMPAEDLGARRWWFVAALCFSLLGDVLLMVPSDRFVAGLGAFLLGHLCYLAGFFSHPPSAAALGVAAGAVVVVLGPLTWRVLAALRGEGPLRVAVGLYILVIAAMCATAVATGEVLAALGAVLFVSSDAMIAWNRFVKGLRHAEVAIMVTYHLAQAALVLSLVR